MSNFNKMYDRLILEYSQAIIDKIKAKFSNIDPNTVQMYINKFDKYKANIPDVKYRDIFQYKTFEELEQAVDAIEGNEEREVSNTQIDVQQDDIVAEDDNVVIYRGSSQDRCILYGQGYTFCISRKGAGNMYPSYRGGKDSTFYFIYFKKIPKEDVSHIMVLDHTKFGYEWTFANNNTQKVDGGWDTIIKKYPKVLDPYKDLLVNKPLDEVERLERDKIRNFINNPSLEKFLKFNFNMRQRVLKSTVDISDDIFKILNPKLINEFLSIGPNLTPFQEDSLKDNQIRWYLKNRELQANDYFENDLFIFNKHDENLSPELLNKIMSDPYFAYRHGLLFLQKNQELPPILLKGIASRPNLAGEYAIKILAKGQKVPLEILKGITSDPFASSNYALDLLKIGQKVPPEIFNSIASDVYVSMDYALRSVKIGQTVPPEILNIIASNVYVLNNYALKLSKMGQKIPPEILNIIASNVYISSNYALELLKINQKVPPEILKGIASDPYASSDYALELLKIDQTVPPEILKGIESDASVSKNYALELLKIGQTVPPEILKSIESDAYASKSYALELSEIGTVKESFKFNNSYEINHKYTQIEILENLRDWFAPHVDKKGKKFKGWINCKTGGPCGRNNTSKGSYPACRPSKSECNKIKGRMYKKKSSKRVNWGGKIK